MHMTVLRWMTVCAAFALFATACDRGGDTEPSLTPIATATAATEATPSPSPTPPPTPTPLPGSVEVPSTVVLIDVRTGAAKTLYEDRSQVAGSASFVDGEVVVLGDKSLRFRLDGSSAGGSIPASVCREANGSAEVGGKQYSGVRCGSISPDRRWMVYGVQTGEVEVGASGYRVPQHDQWSVNLDTGATRRLQAGLVHCGGCDARYGPRWSPSSRYVAYAEFGGQGRRFLSDVTTGSTRQIANGNEVGDEPVW